MNTKDDQQEMEGFQSNPARYARLAEPFADADALNEACKRFADGLSKLREECGIPEVVATIGGRYLDAEGDPVDGVTVIQFGDATKAEGLAAYLYGKVTAEREALVARMLKQGRRR